ncbi:MAG: hypothetical protein HQK54_10990 [Oligoflexales bacterium]|nr:hypothetical protein [Oligoflexales bacterium]
MKYLLPLISIFLFQISCTRDQTKVSRTSAEPSDQGNDPDTEPPVSKPTVITGIFLVCSNPTTPSPDMLESRITCGLKDKDGKKLDPSDVADSYKLEPALPKDTSATCEVIIDKDSTDNPFTIIYRGSDPESIISAVKNSNINFVSEKSGKTESASIQPRACSVSNSQNAGGNGNPCVGTSIVYQNASVCNIGASDVPAPTIWPLDAEIKNIRLAGEARTLLKTSPGASFSLIYDLNVHANDYCPGCIQQFYIGWMGQSWSKCSQFIRGNAPGKTYTDISVTITAPSKRGAYYLSTEGSFQYSCSNVTMSNNPATYFALICVE